MSITIFSPRRFICLRSVPGPACLIRTTCSLPQKECLARTTLPSGIDSLSSQAAQVTSVGAQRGRILDVGVCSSSTCTLFDKGLQSHAVGPPGPPGPPDLPLLSSMGDTFVKGHGVSDFGVSFLMRPKREPVLQLQRRSCSTPANARDVRAYSSRSAPAMPQGEQLVSSTCRVVRSGERVKVGASPICRAGRSSRTETGTALGGF